jgi:hypothetical protein
LNSSSSARDLQQSVNWKGRLVGVVDFRGEFESVSP